MSHPRHQFLDYHKPEPLRPEARPGFRFGAAVLFVGAVLVVTTAIHDAFQHGEWRALAAALPSAFGVYLFGSILILGRYPPR